MNSSAAPGLTSLSLLRRVRSFDAAAWERLSALYGPVVYGWCRRAGLQGNDAADAVQEVFRSVFRGIAEFRGADNSQNGSSFRGWLWVITRNQVRLFFRRRDGAARAVGGTDAQMQFAEQPDSTPELDEVEPDAEQTRRQVLQRALELVKSDFNETTWQAFARITLQGCSISEVAVELELTENAVRQAKFRVLRRLREELDGVL